LRDIEQWHQWEDLLKEYTLYVYPRYGVDSAAVREKYISTAKEIVLFGRPFGNGFVYVYQGRSAAGKT